MYLFLDRNITSLGYLAAVSGRSSLINVREHLINSLVSIKAGQRAVEEIGTKIYTTSLI